MALEGTPHIKRPDLDNIIKFYLDALEGVCYDKDENVCVIQAKKIYSYKPRVEIEIDIAE